MSQRSHIASSGSTAICECSAACSAPSITSSGKSSRSTSCPSSYQSACVVNDVCGRSSADEVEDLVVGHALALVGEHLLGDGHRAEGQRHAQHLAAVEQALDLRVGLALGLRVPVAGERLDEHAPLLEVELGDLERAPAVQVDGALVGGVHRARERRPCRSARPSAVSTITKPSRPAERSDTCAAGNSSGRRGTYWPPGRSRRCAGARRAARRSPSSPRRGTRRRSARAGPRARRRGCGRRGSARSRGRGSRSRPGGRGTRRGGGRRTGRARPRPRRRPRARARAGRRGPTAGAGDATVPGKVTQIAASSEPMSMPSSSASVETTPSSSPSTSRRSSSRRCCGV